LEISLSGSETQRTPGPGSWQRVEGIEKGGWDRMPRQDKGGYAVARGCANVLELLFKK
jgi:hypothetical protein